ncbi:MAG TPA: hypothetical protein VN704_00555 [Verrucomicrobiae bacterium]|nr:hypothetical protein [Verrucomicrobiae bacterium]
MKVGAPHGSYFGKGYKENMTTETVASQKYQIESPTQIEWADMSRGLNYSAIPGYGPVMRMLNSMEKAQGPEVITDNRSLDADPF